MKAKSVAKDTAKQVAELKVKKVRLSTLTEDPANARKHDKRNMAAIAASLQRFGQVEPLVVQASTKQVIGGNGRLTVMRELKWKTCSIVEVDVDNNEATALGIALNRTGELAEWDLETLGTLIGSLEDTERLITGFSQGEIDNLLNAEWKPEDAEGSLEDHERKPTEDKPSEGIALYVTAEQWEAISKGLDQLRTDEEDQRLTLGVALQRFAEFYLEAESEEEEA